MTTTAMPGTVDYEAIRAMRSREQRAKTEQLLGGLRKAREALKERLDQHARNEGVDPREERVTRARRDALQACRVVVMTRQTDRILRAACELVTAEAELSEAGLRMPS